MLDRLSERTRLDLLLASLRNGRSATLLLEGGAGVGKTTLLEYLEKHTAGFRQLSVTGIQSEIELAFAALHQLCRPLDEAMAALAAPQREALETTFGQRQGPAPSPFLVGLATLNLLSEASRSGPILCIVDDAQWLDEASAHTLGFVARRLAFEPVGMVFAVRSGSNVTPFDGIPPINLGALERHHAEDLLASLVPGAIDQRAKDRVLDEASGNPLAIVESARALTRAEISTGMILADVAAGTGQIERHYQALLALLPEDTQKLLLVAAAEPSADPDAIFAAAASLGAPASSVQPAIDAGLARAPVRFRHPLVRLAAYRAPTPETVRAAHLALASTAAKDADPDLLAWHRAKAVDQFDEGAAEGLAAAAMRVNARGGSAAAAALLRQAVAITNDPGRRSAWLLSIAQAELAAGEYDAATRDLVAAQSGALEGMLILEAQLTEARISFARDRGGASVDLILDVAGRLAEIDADRGREAYLEALSAAMFGASLAETDVRVVSERWVGSRIPPGSRPAHRLLDAMARVVIYDDSVRMRTLAETLQSFESPVEGERSHIHWLWHATIAALAAWDFTTWDAVSRRHLAAARAAGDYTELPIALTTRTFAHLFMGEFAAAVEATDELSTIAAATGSRMARTAAIGTAALMGRDDELRLLVRSTIADSDSRADGSGLAIAQWGVAVLANARGNYGEALEAARQAVSQSNPLHSATNWALTEMIEAASRMTGVDTSSELDRLGASAEASGTSWGRGVFTRSKALLSRGDDAEALYLESIQLLEESPSRLDLARSVLVYGEWLRRQRRQTDARTQLNRAHASFERMGAWPLAERAARELRAAGVRVGASATKHQLVLTSQESQIAQLVAQGLSNGEVAIRMFLSPRTVEHHLGKVFTKLKISSRHQLVAMPTVELANGSQLDTAPEA